MNRYISEYNEKYLKQLNVGDKFYQYFDLKKAASDHDIDLGKLPYSLRVLLENVLRRSASKEKIEAFGQWQQAKKSDREIDFYPARVLMQDFTGVPAVVDLASMRDAMRALKDSPEKVNPQVPVDLVIDHSVQVYSYGKASSFSENVNKEIELNNERYKLLKWGQENFDNFRVVPPGTGICHQVNLEYLAKVVWLEENNNQTVLYPDSLVGTDSHTTMINALSVLGWGVGGIEAEAAMLDRPLSMILPEVVGFKLSGKLSGSMTATDLVLTITKMCRETGVVGKFVEFYGPGLDNLSLADRATISNMSPEFGATCAFFPIDEATTKYLKLSGRDDEQCQVVEQYAKEQQLWRDNKTQEYSKHIELDLSKLEPSLAGPTRPQDLVAMSDLQNNFQSKLPELNKGTARLDQKFPVKGKDYKIGHGDLAIAAITSCTNTSNPSVMIAAGLLARNAVKMGLNVKPWVKTSLAPGSKVVTEYLQKSGLNRYLDQIGFNLVGYGCTTCIGNSGPLDHELDRVILSEQLVLSSVLSGNRNFEGRIHPMVRANYLASPPLVVAYALAGTVNIDLATEPLALDENNKPIYLKDIWPTHGEIEEYVHKNIEPKMFKEKYADVFFGDENWRNLDVDDSSTFNWDDSSSYIKNPPYFETISTPMLAIGNIQSARILAVFGDSITTDHISPAGVISKTSPAAKYLMDRGISPAGFNSYGARRGNHEIMMRGTFANVRIKNKLCPGVEGGVTVNYFTKEQTSIYDAAMDYKSRNIPLVVFAGKEYGSGSSRDWAAKGTKLLGVKAVIAESFERIHRSNLVGMGVLPITFKDGKTCQSLGLDGTEEISIVGLSDNIKPLQDIKCFIKRHSGNHETIDVTLQILTDNEINYIKNGGVLSAVIRDLNQQQSEL